MTPGIPVHSFVASLSGTKARSLRFSTAERICHGLSLGTATCHTLTNLSLLLVLCGSELCTPSAATLLQ